MGGVIAMLFLLLAVSGCGSSGRSRPVSTVPTTEQPATRTIEVTEATLHDAQRRAVARLRRALRNVEGDPFVLIGVAILAEQYDIPDLLPYRRAAQRLADTASSEAKVQMRLIDPAAVADPAEVATTRGNVRVVAEALSCDQRGSPPASLPRLRSAVDAGGYSTTHALVAIRFRDDLGCGLRQAELG